MHMGGASATQGRQFKSSGRANSDSTVRDSRQKGSARGRECTGVDQLAGQQAAGSGQGLTAMLSGRRQRERWLAAGRHGRGEQRIAPAAQPRKSRSPRRRLANCKRRAGRAGLAHGSGQGAALQSRARLLQAPALPRSAASCRGASAGTAQKTFSLVHCPPACPSQKW